MTDQLPLFTGSRDTAPAGAPRCRSIYAPGIDQFRCTEPAGDHQGRPHGHGMKFWQEGDTKVHACAACGLAVHKSVEVHESCAGRAGA